MNTVETKSLLAKHMGLTTRTIQMYYSGTIENLSYQNALKFLIFFNKHRLDGQKTLVVDDILVDVRKETIDAFTSTLKFKTPNAK